METDKVMTNRDTSVDWENLAHLPEAAIRAHLCRMIRRCPVHLLEQIFRLLTAAGA